MPTASDELRKSMRQRFGSIDTHGPEKFLTDNGYSLSKDWEWSKPGITGLQDMTREEFECLLFLVHEWDYGSLLVGHSNEELTKDKAND